MILNTLLTHLQLFGIGFTFGMAGPCLLLCTPILLAYVVGSLKTQREIFRDALLFFTGRLIAYLALGILAGLSGLILKGFLGSNAAYFLRPLGGVISILLGVIILVRKEGDPSDCRTGRLFKAASGSLFILGLLIGLSPCSPLLALLFEITLISKNVFDSILYTLSFALGTISSGIIIICAFAGILRGISARLLKSARANLVIKLACALLLIIFGIYLL